jgi:hypothetical protein
LVDREFDSVKPSTINRTTDTLVISAGIVGISTAYYLKLTAPDLPVTLVDMGRPMELTSAHSGENYRNGWPHPVMERFTNDSIDQLEDIARQSDNRINLIRRGYVLATRKTDIDDLLEELLAGYAEDPENAIRIHETNSSSAYEPALENHWQGAPSGVDVLRNDTLIKQHFPLVRLRNQDTCAHPPWRLHQPPADGAVHARTVSPFGRTEPASAGCCHRQAARLRRQH